MFNRRGNIRNCRTRAANSERQNYRFFRDTYFSARDAKYHEASSLCFVWSVVLSWW